MIYKISFRTFSPVIIPFNNKYKLNSFIYSLIQEADTELFDKLHNNKWMIGGRPFKPFVFSNLFFKNKQIFKSYGILAEGQGTWYFATSEQNIADIVKNQIKEKGIKIDNTILTVDNIKEIRIPDNKEIFSCLSPVCITIKQGNLRTMLNPADETYIDRLKKNIIKKYHYMYNKELKKEEFDIEVQSWNEKGSLESYKGTDIKSYQCTFKIKAPQEVKQAICTLGVGNFNCQGFGFVLPSNKGE